MLALLLSPVLNGCVEAPHGDGVEGAFFDDDYGKSLLENPTASSSKEDSLNGRGGLPISVDSSDTAVWEVRNHWAETDTLEARAPGIAWPADSGLTWDQKYGHWIESMARVEGHETFYQTFELTTPWGRALPAPSLECAEVAIFLRVTFASWYGLPFFMEAVDGKGKRVYFGHFGARTAEGRYGRTARYKRNYQDFSHMSVEDIEREGWPSDAKLRGRKIGGSSSDIQGFIGPDAHAGAYFDDAFLNKRTGYFLTLMLSYFGSINLASSKNTFNLFPEAIEPGDTLLERWQRRGIGHTLVVKHVNRIEGAPLEAELVSGSMPRRQPKWEDAPTSKRAFALEEAGGEGSNSDGDEYASLGGGLKRWRVAVNSSGRWTNIVLPEYEDFWIPNGNLDKISARPAQFQVLLGEVSKEQLQEVLLRTIQDQRQHLRTHPASCSARIRREDAFNELYTLNAEFGLSKEQTDNQFRELEDYVFARLVYEDSRTCCWNSSTAAMFEIAMDLNRSHVLDGQSQTCNEPITFKAVDGDFEVFRAHAEFLGRGAEWLGWSEDESCPQRNTLNDAEAEHAWSHFCEIRTSMLDLVDTGDCPDVFVGNDRLESAAPLSEDSVSGLAVCDDVADFFAIEVSAGHTLNARIAFAHDEGDLDLAVLDASGAVLGSSDSVADAEDVSWSTSTDTTVILKVFGFDGAANTYNLTVSK